MKLHAYLAALAALSLVPDAIAQAASQDCNNVEVNNDGKIETQGKNSPRITVRKNGVEITNSGRVFVNEHNCAGVSATGRGSITVTNHGSITTTGNNSPGISVTTTSE